jgi:hypothetical protein
MRTQTFVALIACTIAGCSFPTSRHPLSDENDSKIDSRLYGIWMFVPDPAVTVEGEMPIDPAHVIGFGKHSSIENALSLISTSENTQNGEKHLSIDHDEKCAVFCTPDHRFFSVRDGEEGYWLFRYKLESDSQNPKLKISPLAKDRIRSAIENGEIAGKIVRRPVRAPKPGELRGPLLSPRERITITATSRQLHRFLVQNPDAFMKDAWTFRRLTVGDVTRLTAESSPDDSGPPRFSLGILVSGVIGGALIGFAAGMWFRPRGGVDRVAPDSEASSV